MKTIYLLKLGILIMLLTGCAANKKLDLYKTEVNNQFSQINEEIKKQVNDLQKVQKSQNDAITALNKKLLQYEKQSKQNSDSLNSQIHDLKNQINGLKNSINSTKQQIYKLAVNTNSNMSYAQKMPKDYLSEYDYLSEEERATLYYLNFARTNPKTFAETFVASYDGKEGYSKGYAFDERKESLIKTLEEMEPVEQIAPDKDLYELAQCFAIKAGELNIIEHDRYTTGCDKPTGSWGECCDYGSDKGFEIVLSLLIDAGENNAALGHRRICLDKNYKKIGISYNLIKNISIMPFSIFPDKI